MPFDKSSTTAMFPHGRFSHLARKGYVNYVPSPVRHTFNV